MKRQDRRSGAAGRGRGRAETSAPDKREGAAADKEGRLGNVSDVGYDPTIAGSETKPRRGTSPAPASRETREQLREAAERIIPHRRRRG